MTSSTRFEISPTTSVHDESDYTATTSLDSLQLDKLSIKSTDDQLWNILPSYQMYNSIYRNIHLNANDDVTNNTAKPPTYNAAPESTPSLLSDLITSDTPSSQFSANANTRFVVADEETNWRETILDNTHLLKNLTDTTNLESSSIDIKIHFTKDICEFGKIPEEIDPSLFEYKQGDYLNGYVLIENTLGKPVPFEMFYMEFQGLVKIINPQTKKYIHSRNFLQMFDFSASCNHGIVNRLVTDYVNPHSCPLLMDTNDGTFVSFGDDKMIKPDHVYKRFFTFKIPNLLLDSECSDHNLAMHVQLPPSLGCPTLDKPGIQKSAVKDFSMNNSAISYGVLARFIGRKSKYNVDKSLFNNDDKILINSKGDEFLILKERYKYVRILQQSNRYSEGELAMKFIENKLMYNNLISRLQEKIKLGNRLIESIQNKNYQESFDMTEMLSQNEIDMAKLRQGYQHTVRDGKYDPKRIEYYNYSYIMMKKSFASSPKAIGTLQIATPKKQYFVSYIPPTAFRSNLTSNDLDSLKLQIPLEFKFSSPNLPASSSSSSKFNSKLLPEIKSIMIELGVLTIKADKYPIPVEFHHDLIFHPENANANTEYVDQDNFNNNVISEFQDFSTKLNKIIKDLGDNLRLERELFEDLKSISQLQTTSHNLTIHNVRHNQEQLTPSLFNNIPWDKSLGDYVKKLNLSVNLESAQLKSLENKISTKSYDAFNLVPDFQYCRMARLYYIKMTFGLNNNQYMHVKVPVTIQK